MDKNADGTITVYRSGTMQDGHNPATTNRQTAEIIASEREKQGLNKHDTIKPVKPNKLVDLAKYEEQNDLEKQINLVKQKLLEKERKKELKKLKEELKNKENEELNEKIQEEYEANNKILLELEDLEEDIQEEVKEEVKEPVKEEVKEEPKEEVKKPVVEIKNIEDILKNEPLERSIKKEIQQERIIEEEKQVQFEEPEQHLEKTLNGFKLLNFDNLF